jgi:hypothetical protein
VPPRILALAGRAMATRAFTHWSFDHYLRIAPPGFVALPGSRRPAAEAALAA